jgi:hypothetical protein
MKPVHRILKQEGEVGFLQRSPPKGSGEDRQGNHSRNGDVGREEQKLRE